MWRVWIRGNMKIYHYDQHDFYYLYPEELPNGASIPFAATVNAPPVRQDWPEGCVPVFDQKSDCWYFQHDDFWRVEVKELCFYTGRDSNGPVYLIDNWNRNEMQSEILHFAHKFPFIDIPRYGSVPHIVSLMQRIDYINFFIKQIEMQYVAAYQGQIGHYHDMVESFVAAIRRLIDDFVVAAFMNAFKEYEPWRMSIVVEGYSDLFRADLFKKKFEEAFKNVRNQNFINQLDEFRNRVLGKNWKFLWILQLLSNTYKHSLTAGLGKNVFGVSFPTITTQGVLRPGRSLGELTYHNHSFRQIVMGLKDYLEDFSFRFPQDGTTCVIDRVDCCFNHVVEEYKWYLNPPYGG